MAACSGVTEVIATGTIRLHQKIAREAVEHVNLTMHNSLAPVLGTLKLAGHTIVGLEQTTNSTRLCDYAFPHRTVLVLGSERQGMSADCLALLDAVVEIPVWGMPHSYNVAIAASLATYEYCRQYPDG